MAKMTRSQSQRYNTKMDRLFERSKVLKTQHAPLHSIQLLQKMTDKVYAVNAMQSGTAAVVCPPEDWSSLSALARSASEVLEYAQNYVKNALIPS